MERAFERIHVRSEHEKIAHLLGLTLEEYDQLSHCGIRQINDFNGQVLKYYTIISPLNPESILSKIKMDRSRKVYFSPYDIEEPDNLLIEAS